MKDTLDFKFMKQDVEKEIKEKKLESIHYVLFDENKNSAGWLHGVYPSLSARPFNAYNEK